jgi:hypothetical protein
MGGGGAIGKEHTMSPLSGGGDRQSIESKTEEIMRRSETDYLKSLIAHMGEKHTPEDVDRLQDTDLYQDLIGFCASASAVAIEELTGGGLLETLLVGPTIVLAMQRLALAGFLLGYEQHELDVQREELGLQLEE